MELRLISFSRFYLGQKISQRESALEKLEALINVVLAWVERIVS